MGILYPDAAGAFWSFLVLTVILGGLTGWATGKAVAKTCRPYYQVVAYMLVLAAFVQFLHYALFGEDLLAPQFFVIGYLILLIAASLGFRWTRARQMVTQYSFDFESSTGFSWRAKTAKA